MIYVLSKSLGISLLMELIEQSTQMECVWLFLPNGQKLVRLGKRWMQLWKWKVRFGRVFWWTVLELWFIRQILRTVISTQTIYYISTTFLYALNIFGGFDSWCTFRVALKVCNRNVAYYEMELTKHPIISMVLNYKSSTIPKQTTYNLVKGTFVWF